MEKSFLFITLFLLLVAGRLHAQVYPVGGNSVLIPPYSVYLADYTEGTSDRLVMNLVLNDVSRPQLRIRLRLKIMSQNITLETKPDYIGPEIILEGGVPLRLTGLDMVEYFNPNNLNFSGITKKEFEKTGALPANFYQFCFEVLEYNRGVKISNTICTNGWLILNDPPLINLPRNGEKLVPTQLQNVIFQWTPRHTGSPNSAFSTEYGIKLVELWPANRNPNDAILTSPPILEETTRATTFIYDVSQTPLELGRHYALQVKAKSIVGADEFDLFKNNGRSEVITFVYGDPCNTPLNILAEATSASRFTVKWNGDLKHTAYSVRYRLSNNPSAQWYTNTTLVPDIGISGLQSNTLYEFQVAGDCGFFESVFSPVAQIKTFDTGEQGYSCGIPLEQFNLDPANLLETLKVGDVIQAGDFDVKIAKVSGSNGTFSGEGVIEVPFFNKASVKAEFANIVVNKQLRMVNGYLNVTGAGVEIIPSGVMDLMDNLSEVLTELDTALANYEANRPQPFDPDAFVPDVTLNLPGPVIVNTEPDGSVVITDATGQNHTLPPGTEAAIVDDKGHATFIDSKGKEHSVTSAQAAAAINREYNLKLPFDAAQNSVYGFDAKKHKELEILYKDKIDNNYVVPYKSVEAGKTDNLIANLAEGSIDKTKIRFEMGGVLVPASPFNGNQSTLTVNGKSDGEQEGLIAIFTPSDTAKKDQVLGRVNVITYNKINRNVVIVPVNGNTYTFGEATSLQTALNKIYSQAVVSWSVTIREGIQVAGIDPFDAGSSGMLSNYTDHMKDVINAYKDNMKDGDDTYYLFLVSNPSNAQIAGFMPRSKQAGFIFKDKHSSENDIVRTIAHELGHGAFNLHHIFMEENFSITEGLTDNLMDYNGGRQLYKYQWDIIRYPPIVMDLLETDEEAKYETDGHFSTVYLVSLMLGLGETKSLELAKATENPDTDIHSEYDFELDQTWAYPSQQGKTHSLTNGFHGVEELLTALKFLYTEKSDVTELGRLLHRYGDTFAHTKIGNVSDWLNQGGDDIDYQVDTWMTYINDKIKVNGYQFVTDDKMQREYLDGKTLEQYLTDVYSRKSTDKFSMYGKPAVNMFGVKMTFEHASADGGLPDFIYLRPRWYLTYVKNLASLLAYKFDVDENMLDMGLFNKMINYAISEECSLKGIIDYEIAKKLGRTEFYIPVFYSNSTRVVASVDAVFNTDYLQVAKNALGQTKKYMSSFDKISNPQIIEITGDSKINENGEFNTLAYKIKFK